MGHSYRSGNITIHALSRSDGANKGVYMTCDEEAKTSGSKKCETLSLKRWIDEKKNRFSFFVFNQTRIREIKN